MNKRILDHNKDVKIYENLILKIGAKVYRLKNITLCTRYKKKDFFWQFRTRNTVEQDKNTGQQTMTMKTIQQCKDHCPAI
jgi:transaldolase